MSYEVLITHANGRTFRVENIPDEPTAHTIAANAESDGAIHAQCVETHDQEVNPMTDPTMTTTEKAMMVRQLLEEITNESDGPTRTLANRMLREDAYTLSEWVRLDAESRARRAQWRVIP